MDRKIILSSAYFAPASYYSKFLISGEVHIEKHENFIKQTYRNRCIIAGVNGSLALTVPVKRGSFHKTAMKDLEIDYNTKWQANHWRTIESAYSSAPFFQFYADDIKPFFSVRTKFLFDHNQHILDTMLKLTGIPANYTISKEYIKEDKTIENYDYRMKIRPKNQPDDPIFRPHPYYQVFDDRLGFIPDLSILDLVFNAGPETTGILKKSLRAQS